MFARVLAATASGPGGDREGASADPSRALAGASLTDVVLGSWRPGELTLAVMVGIVVTAVYLVSAPPTQPIDYFVRLADAFLHGRLTLLEAPSWLNELIPTDGGWYVPYPPMPAVVLLPFVAVFGTDFPQQVASCVAGGIGAGLVFLAIGRLGLDGWRRLGLVAVFSFGTVLWWGASEGSAWLIAQAFAVMFSAAALLVATNRRWHFLAGLLLGCATASRLPVGLSAPFFLALAVGLPLPFDRRDVRRALVPGLLFVAGLAIPVGANALYNLARWGTPIDVGYTLIPGVLEDPIYADHGILSVAYVPRHIYAIFLRSLDLQAEFPWFRPSWWGLSLLLTTPLYLWLAKAPLGDSRVRWAIVGVGLAAIPIVTHGNVGIAQWGYRFSLDVQIPLFAVLAIVFAAQAAGGRVSWRAVTAGALAIAVNLYGIVCIRNGFVGY